PGALPSRAASGHRPGSRPEAGPTRTRPLAVSPEAALNQALAQVGLLPGLSLVTRDDCRLHRSYSRRGGLRPAAASGGGHALRGADEAVAQPAHLVGVLAAGGEHDHRHVGDAADVL